MQAEVCDLALLFVLLLRFLFFAAIFSLELIQTLLGNSCLLHLLIDLEHIFQFLVALLHLEDDSASLNAIESVSASDE